MCETIELWRCSCGHYYDREIYDNCPKCGAGGSAATLAYRGRVDEDADNEIDFRPGRATEY